MNVEAFVRQPHPFLAGMSPAHLRIIAASAQEVHFAPPDLLFREGEYANRFYLITRGAVALQTHSAGKPSTVQTVADGDVVGWSWLFPPHRWHFDARVVEDTDAIMVHSERVLEECEVNPALGYDLMKRVAGVVVERLQMARLKLVQAQKSAGLSSIEGVKSARESN